MASIHIEGSSHMNREKFVCTLNDADHTQDYIIVTVHRSNSSLIREWAAHKLLYSLGMWKSHTESVDLNYPQKWYVKVGYFIIGGFSTLFY